MGKKKISISKITQERLRQVRTYILSNHVFLDYLLQEKEGTAQKGNGAVIAVRCESLFVPLRLARSQTHSLLV